MNGAKSSTATGTTGTAELPPRGRFAPSPTGPLHLGSLCTAVGSWLDARARGGQWLVRIEDVDRSRADRQRASQILGTLESFALTWDGPVLYQSERSEAYAQALARLAARDLIYACTCTRSELPPATDPEGEAVYPGTCRAGVTLARGRRSPAADTAQPERGRVRNGAGAGRRAGGQGDRHTARDRAAHDALFRGAGRAGAGQGGQGEDHRQNSPHLVLQQFRRLAASGANARSPSGVPRRSSPVQSRRRLCHA